MESYQMKSFVSQDGAGSTSCKLQEEIQRLNATVSFSTNIQGLTISTSP